MAQTRALHLAPARGGVCRMTLPFERGLGLRSLRFENSPEPASKMS